MISYRQEVSQITIVRLYCISIISLSQNSRLVHSISLYCLLFRPKHKLSEETCLTSSYCNLLLIYIQAFSEVSSGNQAMGKFNKCINNLYLFTTRILFAHDCWKMSFRECFLMVNWFIRAALAGLCYWRHCGTADCLSVWSSPCWQMCFQCCRDWNTSNRR